jgi:hypothetical protein
MPRRMPGRCGGEAYEGIIGSERTLIRWGSSTTTAPRSILGAISATLASNILTWPIGFRGRRSTKQNY